ncbi:hypothetical protein PG991_014030 [Apiospora marii]|uniref:Nephrocystin 3-like N-terminal domain-containing protein n=1 Tax=Apiospora marii TaxID=335849 RepID=A0ABR1R7V0_9PEZI
MDPSLFVEARERFLASLPAKERTRLPSCDSAQKLLEAVSNMKPIREAVSRENKKSLLLQVNSLIDVLRPYLDCVNLVVAANSSIASPVWGALRLVFEMAARYTTFFERITILIRDITMRFPKFGELDQLLTSFGRGMPATMQKAIAGAYGILLSLIQEVLQIFYKRPDQARSNLSLTVKVFTTPWESRFTILMKELELYNAAFHAELQTLHFKEAMLSDEMQRQNLSRTMDHAEELHLAADNIDAEQQSQGGSFAQASRDDWLSPPRFVDSYQLAIPKSDKVTANWFLDGDPYTTWKRNGLTSSDPSRQKLLWVNGNPGAGKTVLASTSLEDLLSSFPSTPDGPQVTYFFFRSHMPGLNNSIEAYRAILSQILHTRWMDSAILDCFSFAMNCSQGQLVASRLEILDLLSLCATHLPCHFLVLDAIDECVDSEFLVNDLMSAGWCSRANLILFSRPTVPSLHSIYSSQTLSIAKRNTEDIRRYSSARLDKLIEAQCFPGNLGTPGRPNRDMLLQKITLGADGMFLWATLLFDLLSSRALTKAKRLEFVLSITKPERLNELYDRIVCKIEEQNSEERDLAVQILLWTLLATSPPETQDVKLAICSKLHPDDDGSGSTDDDEDPFPGFSLTAIVVCGALVEETRSRLLCFVHLSAREYVLQAFSRLTSSGLPSTFLNITIMEGYCMIIQQCVGYISGLIPHLSGIRDSSGDSIEERFPLAHHAAFHLAEYISQVTAKLSLYGDTNDSAVPLHQDWARVISNIQAAMDSVMSFIFNPDCFQLWLQLHYLSRVGVSRTAWKLQILGTYNRHIQKFSNYDLSRFTQALQTFADVGVTLQNIERDWGDQLVDDHSFVWRPEIGAFTPNKYIPPVASTSVDVLAPTRPDKPTLARNFSQKKTVLSKDGEHLFSLSIWPAAAFEDAINSNLPVTGEKSCNDLYQGWLALYEIWRLEDGPVRMLTLTTELARDELKALARGSSSSTLKSFQIPMDICPGSPLIFVLQTILAVHYDPEKSHPQLASAELPLWSRATCGQIWDATCSEAATQGQFSPYGECFLLWERCNVGAETVLDMSLFDIAAGPPLQVARQRKTEFVSQQQFDSGLECSDDMKCLVRLHSTLPLAGILFEATVYIWDFTNEIDGLHTCFWSIVDEPQTLGFSACGEFVLIQLPSRDDPCIESLADLLGVSRFAELLATVHDESSEADRNLSAMNSIQLASGETLDPNRFKTSLVRTGGIEGLAVHKGSILQNQLSISKTTETLSLRRASGHTTEELELVKLPARRFDNLNVLLSPPEDPYITILVLKDGAGPAANSNGTALEYGDLVIRVKKDTLKPASSVKQSSLDEFNDHRRDWYTRRDNYNRTKRLLARPDSTTRKDWIRFGGTTDALDYGFLRHYSLRTDPESLLSRPGLEPRITERLGIPYCV